MRGKLSSMEWIDKVAQVYLYRAISRLSEIDFSAPYQSQERRDKGERDNAEIREVINQLKAARAKLVAFHSKNEG